jgi:stage V sporulation protein SpoVS
LTHLFEDGHKKVVLTTVGTKSIGVALKAMALSRAMSQSKGLDVEYEVTPYTFRPESENQAWDANQRPSPAIRFEVVLHQNDEPGWKEIMEEVENEDYISCAANTAEGKLAGSIAIRLQQTDRVRLKSMGNEPGIQAARALAVAQRYVNKDTFGKCEMFFIPRRVLGVVAGKSGSEEGTSDGCSEPWCCPNCHKHNKFDVKNCTGCGTPMPKSGLYVGWDWKVCKRPIQSGGD